MLKNIYTDSKEEDKGREELRRMNNGRRCTHTQSKAEQRQKEKWHRGCREPPPKWYNAVKAEEVSGPNSRLDPVLKVKVYQTHDRKQKEEPRGGELHFYVQGISRYCRYKIQ